MNKKEIGSILKGLREKSGKTQKEVAELLGRKQQVVGHWETGYAQPDANTLFLLCKIYDADLNEAFGFGNKKSPAPAEAETEEEVASLVVDLADLFKKHGYLEENGDISSDTLRLMKALVDFLDSYFSTK